MTTVHSSLVTKVENSVIDPFIQTQQSGSMEESSVVERCQLIDACISFSKLFSTECQQTIQSSEFRSVDIQTANEIANKSCALVIGITQTTLTELAEASGQVHVVQSEAIYEQNLIEVCQEQNIVHSRPSTNFVKPLIDAFIQTEQTDVSESAVATGRSQLVDACLSFSKSLSTECQQTGVSDWSEAITQFDSENLIKVNQEIATVHSSLVTKVDSTTMDAIIQTQQSGSMEESSAVERCQLIDACLSFSKLLSTECQQTIQSSGFRSVDIQTANEITNKSCDSAIGITQTTLTEWAEASGQ
ncbi:hypothetical protein Ciccas_014566, partial [Cichlidogyrus casuarinus]